MELQPMRGAPGAPVVVNLRTTPFDVYIGRPSRHFPVAPWGNPYRIGRDGSRAEVITRYAAYLLSRPDLLARLPDLRGLRLGCYCPPLPCHGDVLVALVEHPDLIEHPELIEHLAAGVPWKEVMRWSVPIS